MSEPDLESLSAGTATRYKRIAFWSILLLFSGLLVCIAWYMSYVYSHGPQTDRKTVTVTVPRGTSVRGIAELLAEKKVIKGDIRFILLAKISGYSSKLQAGEFLLKTGLKPGEVLEALASARSIQYSVTIPEGLRAAEIAAILEKSGWCTSENFIRLISDPTFLDQLGFGQLNHLEGYLFPDTYMFTRDISGAENIIPIMVNRFSEIWENLTAALPEKPDRAKTVILASIVEKETGAPQERPLIAGVFHNRLKKGMRLQSDPTVVYGTKKFSEPITRKDLRTPTPYNTYTLAGLPIGPISNPGKEALWAVLHPTPTKNFYFVSKNNGTHHFSATLTEHNRAVRKYQRKKSAKKGK